jgi:hypothetical protein
MLYLPCKNLAKHNKKHTSRHICIITADSRSEYISCWLGTNTLKQCPAVTNADEGAGDTAITDTTLTTSLTAADSYNGVKIILFTAAWDSFSVRVRKCLMNSLKIVMSVIQSWILM